MSSKNPHINPGFKKKALVTFSIQECKEGLEKARPDVLAYLISKAESIKEEDQNFVRQLISEVQVFHPVKKIAISGSPGVGKSSFIDSFGQYLLDQGNRIAVLPVDPSSYISKGSILGDKTRMESISRSDMAFIKPMPSSLALGGLAPASSIATMICERSCFDYIILETVGVGQSEVEARNMVDMFLLLLQPGGGDDLQGIKRGIMELADLFIVTKSDGTLAENAKETTRQIKQAMGLLLKNSYGWKAKVLKHSADLNEGNQAIHESIDAYFNFMAEENRLSSLRKDQNFQMFADQSQSLLLKHVLKNKSISLALQSIKKKLENNDIEALAAINELEDVLNALQ